MNEKLISELALKSYIVVGDYSYCESVISPKKFAELIIKECLDIASKTHETKYGKMSCANDDETVRLIKERFGIE